jgi:hypothetical protein
VVTAKTEEGALALEAQKGADRVRAEQERWFRAGLRAAAGTVREWNLPLKHRDLEGAIRCLPVPEDV